jgi:hypothetical protein
VHAQLPSSHTPHTPPAPVRYISTPSPPRPCPAETRGQPPHAAGAHRSPPVDVPYDGHSHRHGVCSPPCRRAVYGGGERRDAGGAQRMLMMDGGATPVHCAAGPGTVGAGGAAARGEEMRAAGCWRSDATALCDSAGVHRAGTSSGGQRTHWVHAVVTVVAASPQAVLPQKATLGCWCGPPPACKTQPWCTGDTHSVPVGPVAAATSPS